jgi:two-component system, chemotaxis family, sensor kinase CheA
MDEMDAIIKEFILESGENLDQLDRDLVELEINPTAGNTLASIFRTIHSMKGASGFLGFSKLGAIAHVGESLLSRLRDGALVINPQIANGLLALVDGLRKMLSHIDKTGVEGDADYSALVKDLTHLQEIDHGKNPAAGPSNRLPVTSSSAATPPIKVNDESATETALPHKKALATTDEQNLDALPERKEALNILSSQSNVRVDVRQLDVLMNLVGELVLARNAILQISSIQKDLALVSALQRLNFVTTELQEGIMKTRLQPIDNVWNKFPRMVRDLAFQRGKKVRLEMEGNATELDKTLIEAIKDPFMHVVRNSIDHGLETPDKRALVGKSAEGRLLLRAFHEGGQVNIEISDDGAGINIPEVKRKAVEGGLATADQCRLMDDQEAMKLIFLPGFSTSEKVTDISGRGVGMDVVKTNIERIGGKISIQSESGLGTTLKMRIPLTLTIMPALVVTVGGHRYAIPQVNVLELVRLEGDEISTGIEKIQNSSVYRLRGYLLPLVWLNVELKLENRTRDAREVGGIEVVNIIVLLADGNKFGLVVDGVDDIQEIVVKALGKQLSEVSTFAGATIMGDGAVALILDVLGLALHARVLAKLRGERPAMDELPAPEQFEEIEKLLLFEGPDDARMAIPLCFVTRLQEFPSSSVERTGSQEVVQYRGTILPLERIASLLPERRLRPRRSKPKAEMNEILQAVIYSKNGCNGALVVGRILDTVEQRIADRCPPSRKGVLASAVIQGRITEILDPEVICVGVASLAHANQTVVEAKVLTVAERRKFSTFLVDGFLFGIEIEKVHEVTSIAEITPVPLAPPVVRGLINLRGQIVTAIDLRQCLQRGERSAHNRPIHLIVYTNDGFVSFLVDEVDDVMEIDEDTFEPPPETLQGRFRDLIRGTYKLAGRLLLVLDADAIMNEISVAVPGRSDGVYEGARLGKSPSELR